ncbi:MAG: PorP/SprF family type IX secretion system membrane protein [Bacteroidota bacterium]
MRLKFISLLLCGFTMANVSAQDQHFSQFFASPLTLNPALTGLFQGKYRVSFIHRQQWQQVLDSPYSTFSAAADFRYYLNPNKRRYKDAFGVGMLFYTDRVSSVNFSTNQIMLSGAFHKALDPRSHQTLSLGIQLGIAQRNLSYDELSFEDEFNGEDGYTIGVSDERDLLPENNFAFGDYQIGLNYSYAPEDGLGIFLGAALHHIGEPEQSFFFEETEDEPIQVSNKLPRRYSGYLNLRLPLGKYVEFHPRVLAYSQGPHLALNGGANFRFLFNQDRGLALHMGGWVRPVRSEEDISVSSAIALLGFEYSNFIVGFSYDIGLDQLPQNWRQRNSFEISVSYLGNADDTEAVPCPKF